MTAGRLELLLIYAWQLENVSSSATHFPYVAFCARAAALVKSAVPA